MNANPAASDRPMIVRAFLRELEGEFQELVEDFGDILSDFSLPHWIVLMAVWEKSGRITQTDAKKMIAKLPKFQSDKARRTLIKRLSSNNLITKTVDPKDERKIILTLTDKAAPKIERYMDRVADSITLYSSRL